MRHGRLADPNEPQTMSSRRQGHEKRLLYESKEAGSPTTGRIIMFRSAIAVISFVAAALPLSAQDERTAAIDVLTQASQAEDPVRGDFLGAPARLVVEDVPLSRALKELREHAAVPLAFSSTRMRGQGPVSCACEEVTVGEALQTLLSGTDFQFVELPNRILIERRAERATPANALTPRLAALPDRQTFVLREDRAVRSAVPRAVVQTGTVQGEVVDAATGSPLAASQIVIVGTDRGAVTGVDGTFRITEVSAGEIQVEARRLGYAREVRTVSLESGETVTVNFQLRQEALGLDEMVVTGVAGGTQRRAVGHSVARISASDVVELAPVRSTQELLSARSPNTIALPGSGMVGTGSVIRIRGTSSIALTSEPIVYVDGVRISNDPTSGPGLRQGRQVNRLNDINPEEIEDIEIIKGPAAATLYGTEAANGVINITTKRGASGAPQITVSTRLGGNFLRNPSGIVPEYWGRDPDTGELVSVNIYDREKAAGRNFLQTGLHQEYDVSLRGGTDQIRYFVSGSWEDSEGIVSYNWQERLRTRSNVEIMALEGLRIQINASLLSSDTRFGQSAAPHDLWTQVVWGSYPQLDTSTRGFRAVTPEEAALIESTSSVNRTTWGLTFEHDVGQWLHHRFTVGRDVADMTNAILYPRHPDADGSVFGALGLGAKWLENRSDIYTTVDYGATATFSFSDDWVSRTSAGFQYYAKRNEISDAEGRVFPASPVRSIGGAAVTFAHEDILENKTAGFFVQEQVEWRNRVFVTGAVRMDDNSAFGADFDAAVYPKFSATWVVHEESFWDLDVIDALRLRVGYGASGMQPDVFDALRLYAPETGPGDASTLTPQSFGNPALKPERSAELEVGFDAALFDERVSLDVTYYSSTTTDAIIPRSLPTSMGFPGAQIVNIGQTSSRGYEVAANVRVWGESGDPLTWDVGLNVGRYFSRVDDIGDTPVGTGFQQNRPGFPIAATFAERILSAEFDPATGRVVSIMCDGGTGRDGVEMGGAPVPIEEACPKLYRGPADPTYTGSVTSSVNLFGNLRLYGMVEFRGGHHIREGNIRAQHTSFVSSRKRIEADDPVFMAHVQEGLRDELGMMNGGFAKLREVSLSYTLPSSIADRLRASRALVNLTGRNLATLWTAQNEVWGQPIPDPETRSPGSERSAAVQTVIPPLSSVMVTVRLNF